MSLIVWVTRIQKKGLISKLKTLGKFPEKNIWWHFGHLFGNKEKTALRYFTEHYYNIVAIKK